MNRFHIYNFGCKVNQQEGGAMAALLIARGWQEQNTPAGADLLVINTCTVTQVADKKCRNLIRRWRRDYPDAILAVTGCYVQQAADVACDLGADIVAGVDERSQLTQLIDEHKRHRRPQQAVGDIAASTVFTPIATASSQQRARAYLKIEDGCDQFCHYCIIPHVRGPVRSLPLNQAVEQASLLLEQGHQELVLTGIHIGAYGQDLPPQHNLPALIRAILALDGSFRLRLGSIEPQQFTPQLLEVIGTEQRVCPHFHIPLQSGCDKTLSDMGRHYDSARYSALLAELRALRGDPAFTTDVMVGYPGETEVDFAASAAFCAQCGLADVHVFPYSRRNGTVAAALPQQVPNSIKAERAAALGQIAAQAQQQYSQRHMGRDLDFVAEEQVEIAGRGYWRGHSENYLTLLVAGQDKPGRAVRAVEMVDDGLLAEEVGASADVGCPR